MQDDFEAFRAESFGRSSANHNHLFGGDDLQRSVRVSNGLEGRVPQRRHSCISVHHFRSETATRSSHGIRGGEGSAGGGGAADGKTGRQDFRPCPDQFKVEVQSPSPTDRDRTLVTPRPEGPPTREGRVALDRRRSAPNEQQRASGDEEPHFRTSRTMTITSGSRMTSESNRCTFGDVRRHDLALTIQVGGRRRSTTCAQERLRPAGQRDDRFRRNSYAGGQRRSSPPLSPSHRASGRTNSIITYLPDRLDSRSASASSDPVDPGRHRSIDVQRTGSRRISTEAIAEVMSEKRNPIETINWSSTMEEEKESKVLFTERKEHRLENCSELKPVPVYRIMILGSPGVGKTTLTRQLLTSEYLANKDYDLHGQEPETPLSHHHSVSIKLDGEEATIDLLDNPDIDDDSSDQLMVDAYVVVYSVTSRSSFAFAELCLSRLQCHQKQLSQNTILLMGNKQDQVRSRAVSLSDGKRLATKRGCRFLEVSALLDHRVEEALTVIIRDTRLERRRANRALSEAGLTAATEADEEDEEPVFQTPCFLFALSLCGKLIHS